MKQIYLQFIIGTFFVLILTFIAYRGITKPLIQRILSAFFLVILLIYYIPKSSVIIYHEEIVGIIDGVSFIKGRYAGKVVWFIYEYKGKTYRQSEGMPQEMSQHNFKGERFIVWVNPLFPAWGIIDFSRPVPDSTEVLSK
jgi:hypothetical protein